MRKRFWLLGCVLALSVIWFSACTGKKATVETSEQQETSDYFEGEDDKIADYFSEEEKEVFQQTENDTVAIGSEETEYQIIIIEPGFYTWLNSIARPEGYYSQSFMEARNQIYVMNWNQRVINPMRFNPNLYEMQINYDPFIDYGYEVNYKLYNYFIFFQRRYGQRLGPFLPRI